MTEQSTLLTLLLIRLDTDSPWTLVTELLWTQDGISANAMPKYRHPHIYANNVSTQKLNDIGISRKYHRRI